MCSKFTIGHIDQDGSLIDIWRGFMAQKIRAAISRNPKICYTCDYYRFCIKAGSIDPTVSENFESDCLLRSGSISLIATPPLPPR